MAWKLVGISKCNIQISVVPVHELNNICCALYLKHAKTGRVHADFRRNKEHL